MPDNHKDVKVLYRYEHSETSGLPCLERFAVLSHTPKGFWIVNWCMRNWVSASGKKRFAYPTPEEAFESYMIRKMRYVENCRKNLKAAETHYIAMKRFSGPEHAEKIRQYDEFLEVKK